MRRPSTSFVFQDLYNAALRDFEKQSGTKLIEHPFAKQLKKCDSAESIAIILQKQAQKFRKLRENDGKIMKFLKSSVDVLYPLFNNPNLFPVIGLVPFPPANAIFTAIAVLLAAIKDVSASYDKLVVIFLSLENFLSRLSINIGIPPAPALTNVLVKIIVELLSTLALVTKEVKRGRFKKFIKKILGENDIEAALQTLDRLTRDEGLATGAQTLEVVNKVYLDNVQQKIREWLLSPDPWKNHNFFREARHNKTGTWLIQGDTYAKWKSSRLSSHLWIKGKLGAGKSVICSAVIEDIRTLQRAGLASLAFFYCDFREDQKKDRRGLLSSLLVQLGNRSDAYSAKLSGFYKAHGCGFQHASDDELLGCLKDMLKLPGQATVYIIIDALDECPTTSDLLHPREKVLNLVKDLVNSQISNLRICVTSRPEADIEFTLGPLSFRAVSLEGESGQVKDIAEYVKFFVNTNSEMQEWKNTDKQMVIDVLTRKAGGMFLWVICQLEILRLCISQTKDIRRALDELPETLDETYARTLERIEEKKWKYAHLFFQCVAVASRPLHVDELAQFLSFDFEAKSTPTFSDWHLEDPARTVLSMCSSLLAVVKPEGHDSPVVQFAHSSVQDYLMSARLFKAKDKISRFHVSTTPAHTIVARACLGLLLHLDETVTKEGLKSFPLAEYAAEYWVGHARIEDVSSKVQDGMNRLFDPSKNHLSIWVWICDPGYSSRNRPKRSKRPRKARATPLHYAAFCGLYDVAKFLIVKRLLPEVNARGDKETPLHVASRRGHADIVQLLLEHGADGKAEDGHKRTPLHLSSQYGHVEVVRILLKFGAGTETRDDRDVSPLERASVEGHAEVARLLLKHGADANTKDNGGQTPLHCASLVGHVGTARVLLEHGADVNARDTDHATPLHFACDGTVCLKGRLDVIRLLVRYHSNIHARDDMGRTPFMVVEEHRKNDDDIMYLLSEYGGAVDHREGSRVL